MRFLALALLGLFVIMVSGCKKDDPVGPSRTEVPEALAGTWTAQSGTINGNPFPLSEILQWQPATVSSRFTFGATGSFSIIELNAAGDTVYSETGDVAINGQSFRATIRAVNGQPTSPSVLTGTWGVSGSQLTLTISGGGNTVVVVLTK